MKEKNASSDFVVTDPEMAAMLVDPEQLRYFAPFIERERKVGEVAFELDSDLSTTYRKVQRFRALGLLKVTREQKRKGKPLKFYRAVADTFFIPNQVTDGLEANSERWQEHWEKDFQRGLRHAYGNQLDAWGQRIYRKGGVFTSALAKGPGEDLDPLEPDLPALFSRFHDSLYLDFQSAKRLQGELNDLFNRYMKLSGDQRYMMRLSFVPVPEDAEVIP